MSYELYQEKGLGGNAMSREKLKELLKRRSTKIGSVVLAAALVFGGGMWATKDSQPDLSNMRVFVDPIETVVIEGEETPLAAPTVKTTKKTKKKKIKLKTKSKKTYTKKGKTTTKRKTSTKKSGNTTTTTETVTVTSIQYKFKKNSKIKTQITTITTTVTTTVTTKNAVAAANTTTAAKTAAAAPAAARTQESAYITARNQAFSWSKVDSRVTNAFNRLGFKVNVNPAAAAADKYTGKFGSDGITVKVSDGTVYHELGHFLAWEAGDYDLSSKFVGVFNAERGLYKETNAGYACGSASEYFAESFCQYVLDPNGLRNSRPQTYAAIEEALSKL